MCKSTIERTKKEGVDIIIRSYDLQNLNNLESKYLEKNKLEMITANDMAEQKGWEKRIVFPDGSVSELQRITDDGNPVYYTTLNIDASEAIRTNHLISRIKKVYVKNT